MKSFSWALLSSLLIASNSIAAPTTSALHYVETDSAHFWESGDPSNAGIVFYLPKTEIVVAPYEPADPRVARYTATLRFRPMSLPNPASIHAGWEGKTIRPYSLKVPGSCEMSEPSLRFVTREMDVSGRTISGAEETLCRFRFAITGAGAESALAKVEEKAKDGTLIARSIALNLSLKSTGNASIPWQPVHSALKAVAPANEELEADEAVLLLGLSVAKSPDAESIVKKFPSEARILFIQEAMAGLFREERNGKVSLAPNAPTGAFATTISGGEERNVALQL